MEDTLNEFVSTLKADMDSSYSTLMKELARKRMSCQSQSLNVSASILNDRLKTRGSGGPEEGLLLTKTESDLKVIPRKKDSMFELMRKGGSRPQSRSLKTQVAVRGKADADSGEGFLLPEDAKERSTWK